MVISLKDYTAKLPIICVNEQESLQNTTSKGNQEKWYLPNQGLFVKKPFYFQDRYWKDFMCEEIAYQVGTQFGYNMAETKACILQFSDGSHSFGSCSVNFLKQDENFWSFYQLAKAIPFSPQRRNFERMSVRERILETLQIYQDVCSMDASEYLQEMILLDYLIGNEDRHTNNFGVVFSTTENTYKKAHHFDHGLSLFEHDERYLRLPLNRCVQCMDGKPFCSDLAKAYKESVSLFGTGKAKYLKMNGLVFPSFLALSYFKEVAEVMCIPLLGEADWLDAESG